MPPKTATGAQSNDKKRKAPSSAPAGRSYAQNKRFKTVKDARAIAAQTTSKAFKNGELDVDKFVKAREYEIRALEEGMERSKRALSKRAFQQVPKELRRRTASHNVKRVPKKLQGRAKREMVEDNTPTVTSRRRKPTRHQRLRIVTVKKLRALGAKRKKTKDKVEGEEVKLLSEDGTEVSKVSVKDTSAAEKSETAVQPAATAVKARQPRIKKNVLKEPPKPKAKFRKRQLHKSWLPTHLFHAKRAQMPPSTEPLWRFAIPLTSTAKSYRPTHRASSQRGAIAWDMSYMATIGLEGAGHSIESVLKALGVGSSGNGPDAFGSRGQKWRNGTRAWQGWLHERDSSSAKVIAPATIIWRAEVKAEEVKNGTKKSKRAVMIRVHPSAFHQLWEEVVRLCKVQKPQVIAEDLRFELGSIEITGPGSTEALLGALWPTETQEGDKKVTEEVGEVWRHLSGVENPAVLPASALLAFSIQDPRLHHPPRTVKTENGRSDDRLLHMLADWPCDKLQGPPAIFDRNVRLASGRALSSQGAINRRKAGTKPGSYPEPLATDPRIPVLLYTSQGSSSGGQATWTLILPWKAVLPVWYSLMYYPLSTGGQPRFGGLNEQRQLAFEAGVPWFPGDFSGTEAGDRWEEKEAARRKKEWERRPKGKRTEYSSAMLAPDRKGEVGEGWACDWKRLLGEGDDGAKVHHVASHTARLRLAAAARSDDSGAVDKSAIVTVHLTLLTRGVASPCARIYRLPSSSSSTSPDHAPSVLRERWLSLIPSKATTQSQKKHKQALPPRLARDAPLEAVQQRLAAELLQPPVAPAQVVSKGAGKEEEYPVVPGEEDLIGFVTTGEFSLTEGKGAAIGSVLLDRLLEVEKEVKGTRIVIVRNAGESLGRLAKLEIV